MRDNFGRLMVHMAIGRRVKFLWKGKTRETFSLDHLTRSQWSYFAFELTLPGDILHHDRLAMFSTSIHVKEESSRLLCMVPDQALRLQL